jgi:hypothetical protein
MLIATWQAEAAGLHRREIAYRAKAEGWPRYGWGVIGWPGPNPPLRQLAAVFLAYARPTQADLRIERPEDDDDDALAESISAAARNAGQAITGRSGAWMHGFAPRPDHQWLWLPKESSRVPRDKAMLLYGGRRAGDLTTKEGLVLVDPAGCVIDTARTPLGTRRQRVDELIWQMSRADSLRLDVRGEVQRRLPDLGRMRGVDVLREALKQVSGSMSHSRGEHKGRKLARQALEPLGLVASSQPHEIFHEGVRIAEADVAVVEIQLDIEVDGPFHQFQDQRLKDEERDRKVRRAGWAVERFPLEMIRDRPQVFIAQVQAAAMARRAVLAN